VNTDWYADGLCDRHGLLFSTWELSSVSLGTQLGYLGTPPPGLSTLQPVYSSKHQSPINARNLIVKEHRQRLSVFQVSQTGDTGRCQEIQ
jgi:hypothetical protein